MSYEKFKVLCRKAGKIKDYKCLSIENSGIKSKVKVNIVFVTKLRTLLLNVIQKHILSEIRFGNQMFYSVRNKNDLAELEELADFQSNVKQVKLEETTGKQSFQYDTKKTF